MTLTTPTTTSEPTPPSPATSQDLLPELDTLSSSLPGWTATHHLELLDGPLTGQAPTYTVGPDKMTAGHFVALAPRTQPPFLYRQIERFDAADFALDEDTVAALHQDDRERYTHLSQRAEKEQGRCQELSLRFVAGGVVHTWTAYASWWDQLTDELDELEQKYTPDEEAQPEDPPSTPEEVDRLAGLLEALPDFREATKRQERERITLRAFPELRSQRYNGLSRLGYDALSEATERIAETSKKIYADFTANLTSLAQEILDAGVLAQATTAAVRRAAIRTFVQERSGGYPPSKDFVELLDGEPLLKKPAKTSRTASPALWSEV